MRNEDFVWNDITGTRLGVVYAVTFLIFKREIPFDDCVLDCFELLGMKQSEGTQGAYLYSFMTHMEDHNKGIHDRVDAYVLSIKTLRDVFTLSMLIVL